MHLPRKANAGNLVLAGAQVGESAANGNDTRPPPILRILFCPSQLWRGEGGVLLRARGNHPAKFIQDERTSSAGADIDPEECDSSSKKAQSAIKKSGAA